MTTKNLPLLLACTILAVASGCTTATKTRQTIPVAAETQPAPIKVDYDISKDKKTGNATSSYLFGFIKISGPNTFAESTGLTDRDSMLGRRINKLRLAAIHNALKGTGADRMVDPQYDCKIITYPFGIFKQYIVTVKGYEASIIDIYSTKN